MKIKVAHIVKDLKINGISTVVMNYVKNLDKSKYDITIIAGNPIAEKNMKECVDNNINLIEIPSKTVDGPIKCYKELFKVLKKENYDIVHIHGNSRTITVELLIAKIAGIRKRIAHCHNTQCNNKIISNILTPLFKLLYSSGLACSEEAGKWMFGKSKFVVLKNGFETEKFKYNEKKRKEIRKKIELDDKKIIGHVGLFNDQKNHAFILETFENLAPLDDDIALLLVGTGPKFDEISEKINNSKYKDRIVCYGVSNNVSELYDAMDLFFFPSKYEGLGIVLLEAQIKGLPCIASDVVPREVEISKESIKFISLEKDNKIWVNEILESLNSERNRSGFYEKNIDKIEKYNIKNCINELEKIYTNLINKR